MDQEIILADNNEFEDIETENKKKNLIILVAIVFAAALYWNYSGPGVVQPSAQKTEVSNSKILVQQKIATRQPEIKKTVQNSSAKKEDDGKIKVSLQTAKLIKIKLQKPHPVSSKIQPTSRLLLARAALAEAGRIDPFADTGQGKISSVSISSQPSIRPFPSVPGQFKISPLPFIKGVPDLPSIIPPGVSPVAPIQSSALSINGFLGNKVIVTVEGETEALSVNEKFKGIKVLSVEPQNLSAKFSYNNSIITRRIVQ